MRGQKEQECFDFVLNGLFYRNGEPIRDYFTGKTYLDADEIAFEKNRHAYCNNDFFVSSTFGLIEKERIEFASAIRKACANPESSLFPDFVFDDGFIEHFRITSSKETRKGATHAKRENEFNKQVADETETLENEWNEKPSFDEVRSKSWMFINPEHSHKNLVNSFKANWEHHMQSYRKYEGSKNIGVFMVEYPEFALAMHEQVYAEWLDGMSCGDMREKEEFKEYRLSRDKELLDYIYEYKAFIKYVIFRNHSRCEVISVEHIPYLKKLLPWDYVIYPMSVWTTSSVYNISVPDQNRREDEDANDIG